MRKLRGNTDNDFCHSTSTHLVVDFYCDPVPTPTLVRPVCDVGDGDGGGFDVHRASHVPGEEEDEEGEDEDHDEAQAEARG